MTMKKYIACVLAALCVAACSQDLGNYDYLELDEPQLSGLADTSVLMFDRIRLVPELGPDFDTAGCSFEWKAIDDNLLQEPVVLSQAFVLDYEVVLLPGSYSLCFTVEKKSSEIYWQTMVNLTVNSSMSEGWMVLCADEGRVRLDMVSAVNGQTVRDVLRASGMQQLSGPRKILWLSDKTDASSPYYLLTDDGATRLGKDSFEWKPEYDFSYEVAVPEKLCPHTIVSAGFGKMIVSGTDAHYCEIMGIDGLYGSAVNKNFRAAPFIGANVLATQIYAAVYLIYDMDGRRPMAFCPLLATDDLGGLDPLMDMNAMGSVAEGMASGEGVLGDAFQEWPEGLDCVYIENTRYDPGNARMGLSYMILTDGSRCYLYGVQLGDMLRYADCTYVLGKGYYGELTDCQDILSGDALYAFSSLKNYMYYSVGSTVYRVNLSEKPLKEEVQFTLEGEDITCLKFNLYQRDENLTRSYDLVVGSVKDGEGVLRVYDGMEAEGDFSNVKPVVYDGFAQIVDATYKERVY